jgi:acyl-CoA reductase-like NAD-dependent aldehyde dehydrogenase
MNKQRRADIQKIIDVLSRIDVQSISDEEQKAFDNLTEGLQAAERGQRMEEVAELLSETADELSELIFKLKECME